MSAGPTVVIADSPTTAVGSPQSDLACPVAVHDGDDRVDPNATGIVEVYPNPPTTGNVGEYVVIETDGRDEPLELTDGHATATIPPERPADRFAVTLDPNRTATLTDESTVELDGHLRFAADGDELTLRNETATLDVVRYDRAAEGEIWYRDGRPASTDAPGQGEWWPQDATCKPISTYGPTDATAFVLPDSPTAVVNVIADADERIKIGAYTFSDETITDELIAAMDRGVDVSVLVERSPVGGLSEGTADALDELDAAGASVQVIGGPGGRYGFHHPKYAVVDGGVTITSENWKPSGLGGEASRGWGVHVKDEELAETVATVFESDASGYDTKEWEMFRQTATFVEEDRNGGAYPEEHPPETVAVDEVELLLAPENAERRLAELLEGAEESIRIVQVQVEGPDGPLLEEAIERAEAGVDVEVLLDNSWYVAEENRMLAETLESAAERDDLPLEVHLADGGDRFDRIHAKGIVIDDEVTVLGSINWNDHSLGENREVAVVLHGEEASAYYAAVFDGDWTDTETWEIPVEGAIVVLGVLAGAVLIGVRFLEFAPGEQETESTPDPVGFAGSTGAEIEGSEGAGSEGSAGAGSEGSAGAGFEGSAGAGFVGPTGAGFEGSAGDGFEGSTGDGFEGPMSVGKDDGSGIDPVMAYEPDTMAKPQPVSSIRSPSGQSAVGMSEPDTAHLNRAPERLPDEGDRDLEHPGKIDSPGTVATSTADGRLDRHAPSDTDRRHDRDHTDGGSKSDSSSEPRASGASETGGDPRDGTDHQR